MMLATIPPPPGQQIDIGPLSIHFYGVLIGLGALLAIGIGRRRYAALIGELVSWFQESSRLDGEYAG